MISRVVDLWHATEQSCIKSILSEGILPGGVLGGRNSVFLSPLEPWHDEFKNTARHSSNYFVQIDPVVLMNTVEANAVVQTANSNILVRGKVSPKAIIKILTRCANKGYVHVWHRELADQLPSSAGPSRCKSTSWSSWKKESGRWMPRIRSGSGGQPVADVRQNSDPSGSGQTRSSDGWMMARCETCGDEFASGMVECLKCGATQFYKHLKSDVEEHEKIFGRAEEGVKSNYDPEAKNAKREVLTMLRGMLRENKRQLYGNANLKSDIGNAWRYEDECSQAEVGRGKHSWAGVSCRTGSCRRACAHLCEKENAALVPHGSRFTAYGNRASQSSGRRSLLHVRRLG